MLPSDDTRCPKLKAMPWGDSVSKQRGWNHDQIIDLNKNQLYVWCLTCSALLLVEYPVQHQMPFLGPGLSAEPTSAVVATLCRSCKRKGGDNFGSSRLDGQYFHGKRIYKNMCKLACRSVQIPTDTGNFIRFVSMNQISDCLADSCVLLEIKFMNGMPHDSFHHQHLSIYFI